MICERRANPVLLARLDRHPQQGRVNQRAGDRQDCDRSKIAKMIRLHHESGPWLALVAL